ncbi:MAG: S41 family peptidase [Undibacterium sp.]|nr:S41 family peptidase [Opitutaceae bacterium]
MFKRILTLAAGALLGVGLAFGVLKLALVWSIWPNRELDRASNRMREVMQLVNENYVDARPVAYAQLATAALHGVADSLDPHSEFLEEKDTREFEEELTGEFGGIGIQVETRGGRVLVIAPIAGTPGDRAGIRRGDEIVSIDGKSLASGTVIDAVVGRLRGKPQTKVSLGLQRPNNSQQIDLTLVREVIKTESVQGARILGDGVGYIQITEFSEHTGDQFAKALETLLKQGASSLVLDLRNNPGGLLDAAVEVAELFFKKGEIVVYTQGRKPGDREDYRSEIDGPPLDLPLAILINSGSASAAEVVTGALKDTGRAVVVGERSFGKGSVQSVFKLKNGEGLRLTTARYYTPSGVTIHEKGIAPQVEVVMTPDEDGKLSLQRARPERDDPAAFEERFGFAPIKDRQLQVAIDVLLGVQVLGDRTRPTVAGSQH